MPKPKATASVLMCQVNNPSERVRVSATDADIRTWRKRGYEIMTEQQMEEVIPSSISALYSNHHYWPEPTVVVAKKIEVEEKPKPKPTPPPPSDSLGIKLG